MRKLKLTLFLCTTMLSLFYSSATYAAPNLYDDDEEEEIIGEAINKAGLQRMLTQRLGKNYLASLLEVEGIDKAKHQEAIQNDIKLFEENIVRLEFIVPNKKTKDLLEKEKKDWETYKTLLNNTPSTASAKKIIEISNTTLTTCHNLVMGLETYAQRFSSNKDDDGNTQKYGDLARLVNISGRQRMLSQRIVFLFLAKRLEIDAPSLEENFTNAVQDYSAALNELVGSLENSPEIDYQLVNVIQNWKQMETLCQNIDQIQDNEIPEMLIISDLLLTDMHTITGLYEQLIDAQIASLVYGNALNQAGRQRMLSQRMAKCYTAIMLDVDTKKHQNELNQAINDFEKGLKELQAYAPVPEVTEALSMVEEQWLSFESIVSISPTEKGFEEILLTNTPLLTACHNVVLMLKVYGKSVEERSTTIDEQLSNTIDKSGRQRMLSQRMMFYCLASTIKPGDSKIEQQLSKVKTDYTSALNDLMLLPNNTPDITERLNLVQKTWINTEAQCTANNLDKVGQKKLLGLGNDLLSSMEEVTSMYQALISNILTTEAVNMAGRQRMITQQLAKNYIFILMGIDKKANQTQLEKNIALFEDQLGELHLYAGTPELKAALQDVKLLWSEYKKLLETAPSDANLELVANQNTPLLQACDQVVRLLEQEIDAKTNSNALLEQINTIGRQRMLSQRIMFYAMLYRHSGYNKDNYKDEMLNHVNKYGEGMAAIGSFKSAGQKLNTEGMEMAYNKAKSAFSNIESADMYELILSSNLMLIEAEKLISTIIADNNA